MNTFRRTIRLTAVSCVILSLAACGHRDSASISGYDKSAAAAQTNCRAVESILVTEGTIQEAHTVIGDIEATVSQWTVFDKTPTPEMLNEALRKKAHEVCADAVIMARYGTAGIGFTSWGSMEANGRAIKVTPAQ